MHNHTYPMPPESMNGASGTVQKSIYRDKLKSKSGKVFIQFGIYRENVSLPNRERYFFST